MKHEIRTNLPNSLLLIMDIETGIIPESMNNKLVAFDKSCIAIAIATLSCIDGKTQIILTNETLLLSEQYFLVHSGMLDFPSKKLSICNIFYEIMIEMNVEKQCHIAIYANDQFEPDSIYIVTNY